MGLSLLGGKQIGQDKPFENNLRRLCDGSASFHRRPRRQNNRPGGERSICLENRKIPRTEEGISATGGIDTDCKKESKKCYQCRLEPVTRVAFQTTAINSTIRGISIL